MARSPAADSAAGRDQAPRRRPARWQRGWPASEVALGQLQLSCRTVNELSDAMLLGLASWVPPLYMWMPWRPPLPDQLAIPVPFAFADWNDSVPKLLRFVSWLFTVGRSAIASALVPSQLLLTASYVVTAPL